MRSTDASADDLLDLRQVVSSAFGEGYDETSWQHALGGLHLLASVDSELVGHLALVSRSANVSGHPVEVGYVESVAVVPDLQGFSIGSLLVSGANALLSMRHEIGMLASGAPDFYRRLGWSVCTGASYTILPSGDWEPSGPRGEIMIRHTVKEFDPSGVVAISNRDGDVW